MPHKRQDPKKHPTAIQTNTGAIGDVIKLFLIELASVISGNGKALRKIIEHHKNTGPCQAIKKSIVVILKLLMSDPDEYFLMKRAATLIANQQLHTNDVQNRKTAERMTKPIISVIHKGIIGESASTINVKSMLGIAAM